MQLSQFMFLTLMRFLLSLTLMTGQSAIAETAPRCLDLFSQDEPPASGLRVSVFKWLTGAAALTPLLAQAGGFSGSGGGEGVAIFPNERLARKAKRLIDAKQPFTKDLRKAVKLRSLEMWESEKVGLKPFAIREGAKWPEIYNQALNNIRTVSPILVSRVEQIAKWMEFSDWDGLSFIPELGDATPQSTLGKNEIRVQLAIRLSDGNNQFGQGPTLGSLRLKVFFNRPLFDLLSPLDQAVLVLHEQLYALAQATGHTDSNEIRPLLRMFFSDQASAWMKLTENGIRLNPMINLIKLKILHTLGDYPLYFANVGSLDHGAPRSAARHLSIFADLLRLLREEMSRCLKAGGTGQACSDQSQITVLSRSDLTEEQAFVHMSYFFSERALNILNAESIMNPELSSSEYEKAMELARRTLIENANRFDPSVRGIRLALNYVRGGR